MKRSQFGRNMLSLSSACQKENMESVGATDEDAGTGWDGGRWSASTDTVYSTDEEYTEYIIIIIIGNFRHICADKFYQV